MAPALTGASHGSTVGKRQGDTMFSKAIYDSVRDQHGRFATRMREDNLLPIGFLGHYQGPQIIDYTVVSAGSARSLHLTVTVPNGETARAIRTAIVPLLASDDGTFVPDLSARVTITTDIAVHHGVPMRRGDLWHIEWSTATPKTTP